MTRRVRAGISAKLFVAIFSTCMLALIAMHWGVRHHFEHGFSDYTRRSNAQQLEMISATLASQYQQHGNWDFLRHNNQQIFSLLHSLESRPENHPPPPPDDWGITFWIIDQQGQVLAGPARSPPASQVSRHAIKTPDGQITGWVIGAPAERLTGGTDIHIDPQQRQTSWLIMGLSTLLAAAMTWFLSRGWLSAIKRLVEGTHQLAVGHLSTRVQINSNDELGSLAENFNHLACALEKNDAMRRRFMVDISHELRTPLAILHGELEAMQEGVRPLTAAAISSLQMEVTTLTKLVDNLHQLSLSDEGALAYRKQNTDLVSLVTMATNSIQRRFYQHQLSLTLDLPERADYFGDPDRLMQLLINLMENSLRYTDAGGGLHIQLLQSGACWVINFADTPPGVADEQLTKIFERFFRTEHSQNYASGGSGLGLSLCRDIVEAHGGTITARTADSGGLQIVVELPSSQY